MNLELVALVALVLAAIPAALFVVNLLFYRRTAPVRSSSRTQALSVLIPARNEEGNIRATLEAVLASRTADFEVIVLDDHSTDQTAAIVEAFARRDPAGAIGISAASASRLVRQATRLFRARPARAKSTAGVH
jgi:cellulose synthase/poly-beta-1,6-N-acetylglucosamine synthase-like glycosyltransferase